MGSVFQSQDLAASFSPHVTQRSDFYPSISTLKCLVPDENHAMVQDEEALAKSLHPQQLLSDWIYTKAVTSFEAKLNAIASSEVKHTHWARYNSISKGQAALFFSAIPSTFNKQNVSGPVFQSKVTLHLGLPMFEKDGMRCPKCPELLDTRGVHALNCKHGVCPTTRHRAMQVALCDIAKSCQLSAKMEQVILNERDERTRPADVLILPLGLNNASPLVVDLVFANPMSKTYLKGSATRVNDHLVRAQEAKFAKSKESVEKRNMIFVPFAGDIYGNFLPSAHKLIRQFASMGAAHHDTSWKELYRRFWTKLQFVLATAVSAQILQR